MVDKGNLFEWQRQRWQDTDPIVEAVVLRMQKRSCEGIKKYGCTMEREDISTSEWIDHAIEEALDFAVYLERLKRDINTYYGPQRSA